MTALSVFNLTWVKGLNRILLWILLLILTALLLVFPVQSVTEYHPVQAPYIFTHLPLFVALFLIWLALILVLFISKKDRLAVNWEHVTLAIIFGLVFIGFWCFNSPNGSSADDIFAMGHVRYLLDEGGIPVNAPLLTYFDFPGMFNLVAFYSQINNLSIFASRVLFLMFNTGLFFMLLYLLFTYSLRRTHLAFLGVILVVLLGTTITSKMSIFTPGAFGFTLLVMLFIIQKKKENLAPYASRELLALELLLFSAMVISYFATSLLLPLTILGIFAITIIGNKRTINLAISSVILFLVIFFAWQLWFTWHTTSSLAQFFPNIINSIKTGDFLSGMVILSTANVGGSTPLWATLTRLCFWGLLIFSSFLAFRNLFFAKKLTISEKTDTGGWVGVLALSFIGLIGVAQGTQFTRYLLYAPFFTVPVLLNFLDNSSWRRMGLAIIICISFLIILPAFMTAVNTSKEIYPHDIDTGIFFDEHSLNRGSDTAIYRASTVSAAWAYYYLYQTTFKGIPEASYYNQNEFWGKVNTLVAVFSNRQSSESKNLIFVVDEQMYNSAERLLDIAPNDLRWGVLQNTLSNQSLFYNNGFTQIYTPSCFLK